MATRLSFSTRSFPFRLVRRIGFFILFYHKTLCNFYSCLLCDTHELNIKFNPLVLEQNVPYRFYRVYSNCIKIVIKLDNECNTPVKNFS